MAVRSKKTDIAAADLIGKFVDVSVELSSDPATRRTWHALVVQVLVGPAVTRGLRSYRLLLRPVHWLLARRRTCRIWRDRTAIEVAEMLCAEHGLTS